MSTLLVIAAYVLLLAGTVVGFVLDRATAGRLLLVASLFCAVGSMITGEGS